MKKLWWIVPLLALLALGAYVVAGPYLALRGISQAIERQDTAALDRHVDFPRLRANLKAQLDDYVVRRAGIGTQSSLLGGIALQLAGGLTGAGVDALVTPLGIGALLQGHQLWKRASGETLDGDTWSRPMPARPLAHAVTRYASTSRFTATVHTPDGEPVVFVLDRQGLLWRLTDIRLPLADSPP
ncbi:DUF2939 domain-containing protein [Stenotrophomonas sp. HITSZ_GD]|uniref:DUF2939 domain-containing protein n=1 Tax=Stenotrophomonas sp. HITSZ_GD TaxID=3037248 RepID=UPI00240E13B1|nr:DUF2939 domain-containing protein [Stenotrophomonas sp. HITSZ_GD]MDG2524738.1 DUF2939 domain-containing protein [Stenotrophomonas sp. HITSZ_GD]